MGGAEVSLIVALVVLATLLLAGVQIGVVLGLSGIAGAVTFTGGDWSVGFNLPFTHAFDVATSYPFIVIPLFIALGTIASEGRITTDLFTAFSRWVGHVPGGIAVATIGTSAGLAAVTGSSIAAAATMTKVALPELRRFRYDERLSIGACAMGGGLAIMIPPSVTLVLYAIFAQTSVGHALIAGLVPGVLLALLYATKIFLRCFLKPSLGPAGPKFEWRTRFAALLPAFPVVAIIAAVVGGILSGIWTPVESAAGAVLMIIFFGLVRGHLRLSRLLLAVADSAVTTASIMMIVVGSLIFGNFLALTGFSDRLITAVVALDLPPFVLFSLIVLLYVLIGTVMEVASTLALTIPLVMPVVQAAQWDPIWFGVIFVLLMEIGAVTPPVGLSLYAVKGSAPDVSLTDVLAGTMPYLFINLAFVYLLYFIPEIALFLPELM